MTDMKSRQVQALVKIPGSAIPEIREIPLPATEEDEVLVRIRQVAFTRRDRLVLESGDSTFPAGSDFMVMGHVALGRVEAVGSMVTDLEPGDLVVPTIRRDCDHCIDARSDMCVDLELSTNCGLDREHGFAQEYISQKARYLVKVPDELENLAILLPLLGMVEKAHMELVETRQRYDFFCFHDEDKVTPKTLISGMGPVGLLTALLTSLYGYRQTVFARREVDDTRARILAPLDIEYLNTSRAPLAGLDKRKYCFRQIFETTGDPDFILSLMSFMDANAVAVLMALPETESTGKDANASLSRLFKDMVSMNQVVLGSLRAGREALISAVSQMEELSELYGDQLDQIISHRIPFKDYKQLLMLDTRSTILPVLVLE